MHCSRITDMTGEKGIIIKGVGGLYTVCLNSVSGECTAVLCRARGVFRHEGITPLPGDMVYISATDPSESDGVGKGEREAKYVIDRVEERKNFLIRPALANLTHLFAVIPASQPKPDLYSADKLVCAAEDKGIEPVIVVTKADTDKESAEKIRKIYKKSGFSVFITDNKGSGDGELLSYIEESADKTAVCVAFAGASGAGKSTLMTRIFPELKLKTGEVSKKIQRGRHTTRHAELYPFKMDEKTVYIADTPGFSMIDFTTFDFVEEKDLPCSFREFEPFIGRCRYTKCTHIKEEGCAVLEGVAAGAVPTERHESYVAMLSEIRKNPAWKRKKQG